MKIFVSIALALFLSACAAQQSGPRVADSIPQDCTFSNSTYGGENVRCRGGARLSGADARRAVEESRQALTPSFFGGIIQIQPDYNSVTTSRWQQRTYGAPKYVPRGGGYEYHYGGGAQWGTR